MIYRTTKISQNTYLLIDKKLRFNKSILYYKYLENNIYRRWRRIIEILRECISRDIISVYMYVHTRTRTYAYKLRQGINIGMAAREERFRAVWSFVAIEKKKRKWHAAFLAGGRSDEGVFSRDIFTERQINAKDHVNDPTNGLTEEPAGDLTARDRSERQLRALQRDSD